MAAPGDDTMAAVSSYGMAQQGILRATLRGIASALDLVVLPRYMRFLDHLAGAAFLTSECGVQRIYKLDSKFTLSATQQIVHKVFLTDGEYKSIRCVCDQVQKVRERGQAVARNYTILVAALSPIVVESILEEEGLSGVVNVLSLPIPLVQIDSDLLSAFIPDYFTSYHIHGTYQYIPAIVDAVLSMERRFGQFESVHWVGESAKAVSDLLAQHRSYHKSRIESTKHAFQSIVLFDRQQDLVSALATQVSYEGLLGEMFDMEDGFVKVGSDITGDEAGMMRLQPADAVHREIRDLNFSEVGKILAANVKALDASYEERKTDDISKLRAFVGKLGTLQTKHKSLRQHVYATETIMRHSTESEFFRLLEAEYDFIADNDVAKSAAPILDDLIFRQTAMTKALRVLCLYSVACDGLEAKAYEAYKKSFRHTYGYEHLATLSALKDAGLLTIRSDTKSSKSYPALRNQLRLVREGDDDPTKFSFYYGFAPASTHLIEQTLCPRGAEASDRPALIFFLGGATSAELASLRALSRKRGRPFVFATTSMICGADFLQSCVDTE